MLKTGAFYSQNARGGAAKVQELLGQNSEIRRDLTETERSRLGRLVSNWKLTPATFAHKISQGAWIPADWLMYLSARIATAIAKGNGRLIISAPPRHGKSELISKYTSMWHLEHYPDKHVVNVAYGATLATDWSRAVRDMVLANQDLLTVRLATEKEDNFLTTQGGSQRAVGLGGPIMGRGAHLLLIDDFIKEYAEAVSETHREYVWNWFVTTPMTRLEPGATVIIIATRWHPDDLIGRVIHRLGTLDKGGRWEYIRIPAICDSLDDPCGRPIGAPLFPERYGLDDLAERKVAMGYLFNAVYQQLPVTLGTGMIKSAWFGEALPEIPFAQRCRWVRIWDCSGGKKYKLRYRKRDWTTGTLMGFDPYTDYTYIADVKRVKISSLSLEDLMYRTAVNDDKSCKIFIERESGSAGIHWIEHLKNNVLNEFTVDELISTEAKVVRAQPMIAALEAGKVKAKAGEWNQAYFAEFDAFPDGEFDDQVDGTAWGYIKLTGKKPSKVSWGRKPGEALIVPVDASSRTDRNEPKKIVTGATWGRRSGKHRIIGKPNRNRMS